MPDFAALQKKKAEHIRKAQNGSAFIAPVTSPAIASLTSYTAGPPAVVDLTALPAGYEDLGWTTTDGVGFSSDVSSSTISSWGSTTPTRSDITSDTSTATVTCQETKLLTLALYTGALASGIAPAVNTGEVSIAKPQRASSRSYRFIVIAEDDSDWGKIYVARFLPRAKVTGRSEQNFGGGDDPISYGVTFTGEPDGTLGYSERWIFGGPGWKGALTSMGFTATP